MHQFKAEIAPNDCSHYKIPNAEEIYFNQQNDQLFDGIKIKRSDAKRLLIINNSL
ncbi:MULTISPECIES: hypothetical protein [Psychromonas]|uniref:hypothetical protein n=1 Tax=Psychromonas TaxID=67572 RepID=UPI00040841A7|nr:MULTISPECIES: hypothetical protein [Psychromonas]MBB1273087.1 hypothetical protein [Psychromonas sp. SR45-3]